MQTFFHCFYRLLFEGPEKKRRASGKVGKIIVYFVWSDFFFVWKSNALFVFIVYV